MDNVGRSNVGPTCGSDAASLDFCKDRGHQGEPYAVEGVTPVVLEVGKSLTWRFNYFGDPCTQFPLDSNLEAPKSGAKT